MSFRVNITPDFGGSPRRGADVCFEANVNYTGIKPVTPTVGYFIRMSRWSTRRSRALAVSRAAEHHQYQRSVAAGIQRASLGANAATEDYFASAYLTGPLFGAPAAHSPQW